MISIAKGTLSILLMCFVALVGFSLVDTITQICNQKFLAKEHLKNRCLNLSSFCRILSVFFALARYRVVKITHFCSDMVLQTTKHTKFYPGSAHSLEVIVLSPVV
jgi:hypothetical protein